MTTLCIDFAQRSHFIAIDYEVGSFRTLPFICRSGSVPCRENAAGLFSLADERRLRKKRWPGSGSLGSGRPRESRTGDPGNAWPVTIPPRTELKAAIVGKAESEKFVIEKLNFQSPRPVRHRQPVYSEKAGPAGPAHPLPLRSRPRRQGRYRLRKQGELPASSAWFAEHGYVALIIDTFELGEIAAAMERTVKRVVVADARLHPGRGREVECRAGPRLLGTRPEVDMQRIGVTGAAGVAHIMAA